MKLKDAVCIVTGSATGIGAACAVALAEKGSRVVINYTKSEAEAAATAKECEQRGAQTLVMQADVANDADCRRMADATLKKWGRIDCLVNNAGVTKFVPNHADLAALTAEDFQRIYSVNVVGAFQMIRAVAATMKQQGRGAVVNISSIAGVMGTGSSVAYAASKGALNTMTLSLARALAPEIRVNAVCPGFVETRWLQQGFGEKYEQMKSTFEGRAPLHQVIVPEDIAQTVVWFLEADRVTGEFVLVDSGVHLSNVPLKGR